MWHPTNIYSEISKTLQLFTGGGCHPTNIYNTFLFYSGKSFVFLF